MNETYIRLEVKRQETEMELGRSVSLYELTTMLRGENIPLFVSGEYLEKNNINSYLSRPFYGLNGGVEDDKQVGYSFFEVFSGEVSHDGIENPFLYLAKPTYPKISDRDLNGVSDDTYCSLADMMILRDEYIGGLKIQIEILIELLEQDGYWVKKFGKFIVLPFSEVYVLGVTENNQSRPKGFPATTRYLCSQIEKKLQDVAPNTARHKRLLEMLQCYEANNLSLTIVQGEIQDTKQEIFKQLDDLGLATDKPRLVADFCRVKEFEIKKGRRGKG